MVREDSIGMFPVVRFFGFRPLDCSVFPRFQTKSIALTFFRFFFLVVNSNRRIFASSNTSKAKCFPGFGHQIQGPVGAFFNAR